METSATVAGRELVAGRARLDVAECEWLLALASFDLFQTWKEDGHSSCVAWLVERCGLARRTAIEKLRVARQLDRRPALAKAFADGDLSYAKARAVSRFEADNPAVEAELIASAAHLTNELLERAVRYARGLAEQDKDPQDHYDKRGVTRMYGVGGANGRIVIDGPDDELDRIMNTFDAYLDWLRQHDTLRSRNADSDTVRSANAGGSGNPLADPGNPPAEAEAADPEDPALRASIVQRRYDAFLDLLEHVAYQQHDHIDVERAAVAVVVDYDTLIAKTGGTADLGAGATITGAAARRLACDAGIHRLIVKGASEILDTGRQTRAWSTPQRRAIRFRHGHQCAIKGCGRRITQIHHVQFWTDGGITAIDNGIPLCFVHHHYVHDGGWTLTYDPNTQTTTLTGPHGQTIESPARARHRRAA